MAEGRKRWLSPIQGAALWILEEAGAAELPALLLALRGEFPILPARAFLGEAGDGLRRLWLAGLIEAAFVPPPSWPPLPAAETERVWTAILTLPDDPAAWRCPGADTPEIVLTEAGRRGLTR